MGGRSVGFWLHGRPSNILIEREGNLPIYIPIHLARFFRVLAMVEGQKRG